MAEGVGTPGDRAIDPHRVRQAPRKWDEGKAIIGRAAHAAVRCGS